MCEIEREKEGSACMSCVRERRRDVGGVVDVSSSVLARGCRRRLLAVCGYSLPSHLNPSLPTHKPTKNSWMLRGLQETDAALAAKHIPLYLLQGLAPTTVPALCAELKAAAVVTDFSPLREAVAAASGVAQALAGTGVPLLQVRSGRCMYAAVVCVYAKGGKESMCVCTATTSRTPQSLSNLHQPTNQINQPTSPQNRWTRTTWCRCGRPAASWRSAPAPSARRSTTSSPTSSSRACSCSVVNAGSGGLYLDGLSQPST